MKNPRLNDTALPKMTPKNTVCHQPAGERTARASRSIEPSKKAIKVFTAPLVEPMNAQHNCQTSELAVEGQGSKRQPQAGTAGGGGRLGQAGSSVQVLGYSATRRRAKQRCPTPRSSGAPTAGHQARAGGTRYIFTSPSLASSRRRPRSSNVGQRSHHPPLLGQSQRLAAWTQQRSS